MRINSGFSLLAASIWGASKFKKLWREICNVRKTMPKTNRKRNCRISTRESGRWKEEVIYLHSIAAQYAIQHGISSAMQVFRRNRTWVEYWAKKLQNPLFHAGTWGGARRLKFSKEDRLQIWSILWAACMVKPSLTIREYLPFL